MATIKKPFVELVEFLQENKDKKVSSILESVIAMAESKKKDSTVIKDADGNVVAIYCYYHKQWEILKDVPYGKKANSASGYNTMCKVGVSKWTKAQSTAKKEKEELLNSISEGEVEASELKGLMEEIEARRNSIDETDMPVGFADEEEVTQKLGL